ncbi:MAG: dUTP diphosphatase [Thermoplasmata archaeon]
MDTVTVRYQIIHPLAKVPAKATNGSACLDVSSIEDVEIPDQLTVPVRTGLKMRVQEGYLISILPRSGLAKRGISISNSPGTIDSDFTNEVLILMYNHSGMNYNIRVHDRIAQMMVIPTPYIRFVESSNLGSSMHRGFESTGR